MTVCGLEIRVEFIEDFTHTIYKIKSIHTTAEMYFKNLILNE